MHTHCEATAAGCCNTDRVSSLLFSGNDDGGIPATIIAVCAAPATNPGVEGNALPRRPLVRCAGVRAGDLCSTRP